MSERMRNYRNEDPRGSDHGDRYGHQRNGTPDSQSSMNYDPRQDRVRLSSPEFSPPPNRMIDPRFSRESDHEPKYKIPKVRASTPVKIENDFERRSSSPASAHSISSSSMNQTIYNVRSNPPDVSQYQKYDGKKREAPRDDYPVFNRRMRFKCSNPYPGEVPMVLEGYPEKDDDMIKVDPILIDPRWNFWNLPVKAKVLLVSNLNTKLVNHLAIFNLFGHYGDVLKVKLFRNDEQELRNIAMIEFRTATFAMLARNMLDQESILGQKLVVSFSRYEKIVSEQELGIESCGKWIIRSFEDKDYIKYRRFASEERMKSNLPICIIKPTVTLVAFNFPPEITPSNVIEVVKRNGFQVVDTLALKLHTRNMEPDQNDLENCDRRRKMFLEFPDTSASLMAMALLTGDPDLGEVVFYFNLNQISSEKNMLQSSDCMYKIVESNDQFQS